MSEQKAMRLYAFATHPRPNTRSISSARRALRICPENLDMSYEVSTSDEEVRGISTHYSIWDLYPVYTVTSRSHPSQSSPFEQPGTQMTVP